MDTIRFDAAMIDTIQFRNMEQGFYDDHVIRVGYSLSPGSFHQLTKPSINGEPAYLISFANANGAYSSKEIFFLGLLFDEKYLDRISRTSDSSIDFTLVNAKYHLVTVATGL